MTQRTCETRRTESIPACSELSSQRLNNDTTPIHLLPFVSTKQMTPTTIDSPGDVSKLFRGYFDYLLGHTFNSPSGSYYWHRKRREVFYLLNHVVQRSPKRQCVGIDLGCGEGTDIFAIRRHLDNSNWKLIGVDAATEGIQLCRIKQEYYNAENIDFGIVTPSI
jgi:hypothetical protein